MELCELQKILDEDKWEESIRQNRDVCGEFPYCKHCDRQAEFPCAQAYRAHYAKHLARGLRKVK